jgi:pimeloyl-ACP methyl ester carboxylesterase
MGQQFERIHPAIVALGATIIKDCERLDMGLSELEVELDAGIGTVPGTLLLPGGRTAAVLLSGGGPFDRDETSGPNAPLRDLAVGLAERGISTLRFDKITHAGASASLTMTEEYLPHALAAISALRETGTERVFVVGHSMGGKIAPRVAAADPSVAGLVVLAGDTVPMHRAAVRVARYLAALYPDERTVGLVETFERQAAEIEAPVLQNDKAMMFGFSGAYWADVRDYDPVATAAGLDTPMLILQGGRDYQVTVADDLAGWRAGLDGRHDVEFRVYDDANHLFFSGNGPSTPEEYAVPGIVDPAVITDIADWMKRR